jgi:signal peptidase I
MPRWLKNNRGFFVFLLCLGVLRTAVADWNPIPSGSMRPTLLEGDVVLVNRLAYDLKLPLTDIPLLHLAEPRRGDVVTFSSPKDGTRLIKRIVAGPGDVVQMRQGRLGVNGQWADYQQPEQVMETPSPGVELPALRLQEVAGDSRRRVQYLDVLQARRDFGPLTVPADSFFMLGDNRDNSEDSRFIGVVPRHLLIGHAHRVLVSADLSRHGWPRSERTLSPIR